MTRVRNALFAGLLATLVTGCCLRPPNACEDLNVCAPLNQPRDQARNIVEVDLAIAKSNPPQLRIDAVAEFTTGGYTGAELIEHVYVTPPADGIYGYTFKITPPGPNDVVTMAITRVPVFTMRSTIPSDLRGVRIEGCCGGSRTKLLDDE